MNDVVVSNEGLVVWIAHINHNGGPDDACVVLPSLGALDQWPTGIRLHGRQVILFPRFKELRPVDSVGITFAVDQFVVILEIIISSVISKYI